MIEKDGESCGPLSNGSLYWCRIQSDHLYNYTGGLIKKCRNRQPPTLHPSRADWPPSYSYRGRTVHTFALRLACSPRESLPAPY